MTGKTANKIAVASIALLAIAALCALVRWALESPNIASISSVAEPRLVSPQTPLVKPAPVKPPAFRVDLATVPGQKKLPGLATVAPAHQPKMPDAVQFAPAPAANLPETADAAGAKYSDLEIALHPSLKYRRDSADGTDIRTAAAAELPTISIKMHSGSAPAPAKLADPSADRLALINANLDLEEARRFVMSMCEDQQGCLWVGTEGGGVQRFDPTAPPLHQWTLFTTKDGLGDDNGYAVACDRLGRIWVGHLNHGVSVWNGSRWQNYEVVGGLSRPDSLNGPIGERVFAIKVCPTDGDVWIATNCGLARFSERRNTWSYLTSTDGLPSDQIGCLAFDGGGNLYAGSQCNGIGIALATEGYKQWKGIKGPDGEPTAAAGSGLPSTLVNDLCITKDGSVIAATDAGLAWSHDHGLTWNYLRGADWSQKVQQRNGGAPPGWHTDPTAAVLAEDYATSVVESCSGRLWIGHRASAAECVDAANMHPVNSFAGKSFATCMLPARATPLVGTYGQGVSGSFPPTSAVAQSSLSPPPMPASATVASDITDAITGIAKSDTAAEPAVTYLGEDWSTGGDWIGRYGRQYAMLFAANWPLDAYISHGAIFYSVKTSNGPNHAGKKDVLRRWMARRDTRELRSLYDPELGHRVQSEIDDHGEVYPAALGGPDIHIWVTVPEGVNAISLYFVNDDGHSGANSDRDFLISVAKASSPGGDPTPPILATARVRNFWGGVYERFAVHGPAVYRFEIQRNHGVNATCSGLFVDRITGSSTFVDGMAFPSMGEKRYDPPPAAVAAADSNAQPFAAAMQLWDRGESVTTSLPSLSRELQIQAMRMDADAGTNGLGAWRWKLRLWNEADRRGFDAVCKDGWASLAAQKGSNQAAAR
jgi:hypothetical protein